MKEQSTPKPRKRNAEKTRMDILKVAIKEFAKNGFSGARIELIADKTQTSKRMLYYYFKDKEGLFVAALEKIYTDVRTREKALALDKLPPIDALKALVRFTFDHHAAHREFIRLVMVENIHDADHIRQSSTIRDINRAAIAILDSILQRGVTEGIFSKNVTALALHWHISALSFFHVSNHPSFSVLFGEEYDRLSADHLREQCVASVLSIVITT